MGVKGKDDAIEREEGDIVLHFCLPAKPVAVEGKDRLKSRTPRVMTLIRGSMVTGYSRCER